MCILVFFYGDWEELMKKQRIVSLHGYCSSHETGFEAVLRDAFSRDYDFRCLDLLGHKAGRDMPEIYSLGDVIARGVEDIKKNVDGESYLFGTSFGGYCVLEAVRQGVDVKGVVLVKPIVDLERTYSLPNPKLEPFKDMLGGYSVVEEHFYGSKENCFGLDVPVLLFNGDKDWVSGNLDFAAARIKGEDVVGCALKSGHGDNRKDELERVVCEVGFWMG